MRKNILRGIREVLYELIDNIHELSRYWFDVMMFGYQGNYDVELMKVHFIRDLQINPNDIL